MTASSSAIALSSSSGPTDSSQPSREGGSSSSGRARAAAASLASDQARYASASAEDQSEANPEAVRAGSDQLTTRRPSGNGANKYGSWTSTSSSRERSRTISGRSSDSV